MSSTDDEVDPHVLRKYSLLQKLGKGVSRGPGQSRGQTLPRCMCVLCTADSQTLRAAGLWRRLEGHRQEEPKHGGPEEDFRRLPERNRRPGVVGKQQ